MFTGLVEAVGELMERRATDGGASLRIRTALANELAPGDSVAANGVCLTVVARDEHAIRADVGPETLRVTTLGRVGLGAGINLERPLRAHDRLGGHFVQGHVDAVATIEELRAAADFWWLVVSIPDGLAPYIVPKGSIAVDGISLTVAALAAHTFTVQIVPFTMTHTNLNLAHAGDPVNLECDIVGKYVVRAVEQYSSTRNRS